MNHLQEKDTVEYYANTLIEKYSDTTAILWKGDYRLQSFSYLDLYNNAKRVISLFNSMGIKKGDKVCVWAYNCPEWVVYLLGCSISGVILVPIDFHSVKELASVIIRKVEAKAILLSRFKDIDVDIPKLYIEDFFPSIKDVQPVSVSDLPEIGPDDLLEIIFTSGTTGDPKGVMITNRNLVSNIRSMRQMMPLDDGYRFLSTLPLSHLLEQVVGLFYPLRFGASILYIKTKKPSEMMRMVKKYRVTAIATVPLFLDSLKDAVLRKAREDGTIWPLNALMRVAARLPFKARRALCYPVRRGIGKDLMFFMCGGAKLYDCTEDFWSALGIEVLQGYGLTEASPVVASNVIGGHKAHTVGRSLPAQEIRIAGDEEILIRGQNITPGYYHREEATRAAFEDGWYKTGDMGEMDSDGYLVIKGRKKEMILTSAGFNVFPQDIEMVLNEHPSVKESCVMAFEEEGRTKIFAAIVPEPASKDGLEEILRKANEKLNVYQRIHVGSFWPYGEFPKTPSLKIRRHEVIRILKEARESEKPGRPAEEKGTGSELQELMANFLQVPPGQVGDSSRLVDDLGLDSLGLAELVVMLEERFRIDFDESNITPDTTVADLRNMIESSAKSVVKLPEAAWARTAPIMQIRSSIQKFLNIYLRAVLSLEVEGRESLTGLTTPAIFVANHVGYLDTFAVFWSLPPHIRRRAAVAAAADVYFEKPDPREIISMAERLTLKMMPFMAPLVMNAFPFSRKTSIRKSVGLLGGLLDDGWSILIYPEGARSLSGEMAPIKPGIGLIAAEMLVPVVPVKLKGSFNILPQMKPFPCRRHGKVVFGKPLYFGGEHDYSLVARKIEDTLRAL